MLSGALRNAGDAAKARDQRQLLGGRLPVGARQFDIASHQHGGVVLDGLANTGAHRADAGDQRGADGEADDEQAEAAKIAAHVEQADADRRKHGTHQAVTERVSTSSPDVMVNTRSARAASDGSWVISTTAVPCLRASSNISSTTTAPVS